MAQEIVFSAEVGSWVCVKKHKVEPNTKKVEVSRALASIHDSMDRKIWEYLGEDFPLEQLDKIAYEISGAQFDAKKKEWLVKGKVSETQLSEVLAKLNNPRTSKKINEVLNPKTNNGLEISKAYITRRVLDLLGFRIELDPKTVDKYLDEKAKSKA